MSAPAAVCLVTTQDLGTALGQTWSATDVENGFCDFTRKDRNLALSITIEPRATPNLAAAQHYCTEVHNTLVATAAAGSAGCYATYSNDLFVTVGGQFIELATDNPSRQNLIPQLEKLAALL